MKWIVLAAMISSMLCFADACPDPAVPDGTYFIVWAPNTTFCAAIQLAAPSRNNPMTIQKYFCKAHFTERFVFDNRDKHCYSIRATVEQGEAPFLLAFMQDDNRTVLVGEQISPIPFPSAPSVWRWYLDKVPNKDGHYYICSSDTQDPRMGPQKRCWAGTGFPGDAGTLIEAQPFRPVENQEWILQRATANRHQKANKKARLNQKSDVSNTTSERSPSSDN